MRKIILAISLMSLSLGSMMAYSQEPSPTPSPVGGDQQPSTTASGNKGSQHQYAPPNLASPTPGTVSGVFTIVGEMSNQDASKQRQYVDQRSSQNNFMDIFSAILTALATIAIAIFTYFLYRTNRELFVSTHRSKLRVHSVFLEKLNPPPKRIVNGSCITHQLHYSVDNIGGSPATITGRSVAVKRLKKPSPAPTYSTPNVVKKTIACGENISESIGVEDALIWASSDSVYDDLHFFGYIDYLDDIGTTRRTAFCRRYSYDTKRFTKVDDEDYEYSY